MLDLINCVGGQEEWCKGENLHTTPLDLYRSSKTETFGLPLGLLYRPRGSLKHWETTNKKTPLPSSIQAVKLVENVSRARKVYVAPINRDQLGLKINVTSASDDSFCIFFLKFRKLWRMWLHGLMIGALKYLLIKISIWYLDIKGRFHLNICKSMEMTLSESSCSIFLECGWIREWLGKAILRISA